MERKTVNKQFFIWNWDEEERWVNDMAAQGWHFVKFGFPCRYTFERGEPGAYQYRIQALDKRIGSKESQDYLAFLRDMNIELVDSYLFWVYLRKPADGQPFELFSDVESKLKHMRRFALIPLLCLIPICINLMWGAPILIDHGGFWGGLLVGMECFLAVLMVYGLTHMAVKYQALEKRRQVQE